MGSLTELARHWSRQTDTGKGIRIEAESLDVLNAHGVGALIQQLAAEEQRVACSQKLKTSTRGGDIASPVTEGATEPFEHRSSRSFGTTREQDVTAAAARAQRTSSRRKTS